ncbi:ribosome biogenesis GTPase YlqF [Vallitalea guaymasensis]|uniref:Ribosome biogenesis GTPase A n=1 Tax=Vallitalea guaymasensis TaxID=1185412 RepID=A0A8J8SAI0_9FIRM|nr:ribosome biogenesis GTPase YlqF [Vallitalea guaymasensis]QUH27400.1 ribosome biogenesis GTPase YlqF [Vallitalea guaymasensis]
MNIQWYPGHMTKAKRMMQENIKLVDVIIELIDARVPISSRNPDMDKIANNKPRIVVFNKIDLADRNKTEEFIKWYEDRGISVVLVNSKNGKGINQVINKAYELCKEKIERNKKRGLINKPIRAMVAGIPNVGKSTFINKLVGKASAKTGNRPGVTKGKQWIKLKKDMELLDTPGILWPKFEDQQVGINLALIGSIKDEILNIEELALILIEYLRNNYLERLLTRYKLSDTDNLESIQILENIAKNRNLIKAGNELDLNKAAIILMDEFRNGILGKITLETVGL